jgi:hypothetical protein
MKSIVRHKRYDVPSLFGLNNSTVFEPVFSHGTVTSPLSRVWNCYPEHPESEDSPTTVP